MTRHGGTACRKCRTRGRRCDKALPACGSCVGKGIECEGYVLRWAGLASRGKNAGKSVPVTKESNAVNKHKRTNPQAAHRTADSMPTAEIVEPSVASPVADRIEPFAQE